MTERREKFDIPLIELGKYVHVKTQKPYEVLGVACHSETLEWLVVYRPLYEHEGLPYIWVRPYEIFLEKVSINGVMRQRFEKVAKNEKDA